MKNNASLLLTILTFCLICTSCTSTEIVAAREEKSDRRNLQLRGVVKSMEVIPDEGAPGLKKVYVFNKAGSIVEESSVYRHDNRAYTKTVNSYNGAGRKISAEIFQDGKLEKKSTFQSDDKGNIIEQLDYDADGKLSSKITNKYNEKGNLIEQTTRLNIPIEGGMLPTGLAPGEYKTIYNLDENGNPKRIQSFFPGEKTAFGDQGFVYNRANQKIEETEVLQTYENKLPRINRRFYRYNEQGDVIEIKNYESIKESNVEEVRDRFKVIDDKGTVQNGLLISDQPFMILWDITVCDYEYDAQNNWTKQICKWKTRESKDFTTTTYEPTRRIIIYF